MKKLIIGFVLALISIASYAQTTVNTSNPYLIFQHDEDGKVIDDHRVDITTTIILNFDDDKIVVANKLNAEVYNIQSIERQVDEYGDLVYYFDCIMQGEDLHIFIAFGIKEYSYMMISYDRYSSIMFTNLQES